MYRFDNSHYTVITYEKRFDADWWKVQYIMPVQGMLKITFNARAQYQWHENILKVQTSSMI